MSELGNASERSNVSERSQFRLLAERRFGPFFGVQFLGAMNIDICISRAIYRSLKGYGIERLTRWTLRMARRRMRLARTGHETFHV